MTVNSEVMSTNLAYGELADSEPGDGKMSLTGHVCLWK